MIYLLMATVLMTVMAHGAGFADFDLDGHLPGPFENEGDGKA